MVERNGPKIDPWGTPIVTRTTFELQCSIWAYCHRSLK